MVITLGYDVSAMLASWCPGRKEWKGSTNFTLQKRLRPHSTEAPLFVYPILKVSAISAHTFEHRSPTKAQSLQYQLLPDPAFHALKSLSSPQRKSKLVCLLYKISFILGPSFSQTSWLIAFFFLPGLQKEEKRTDYLLMLPCLDHKVYSVVKCPPATFKESIWWIAFTTL